MWLNWRLAIASGQLCFARFAERNCEGVAATNRFSNVCMSRVPGNVLVLLLLCCLAGAGTLWDPWNTYCKEIVI